LFSNGIVQNLRALVVLLPVIALAGCAAAPAVDSFVDPAAAGQRYDGFLAYAAFSDLGVEANYEKALCLELRARGHACTTMLSAAPPTREQDAASRHAATRASGAQATIVIELADMESLSRRVIANARPAYDVSLVDNEQQQVVARFFLESPSSVRASVRSQSESLAQTIATAMARSSLLTER